MVYFIRSSKTINSNQYLLASNKLGEEKGIFHLVKGLVYFVLLHPLCECRLVFYAPGFLVKWLISFKHYIIFFFEENTESWC